MHYGRLIWYGLAGAIIGYALMHPFAMLAYILGPQHPHSPLDVSLWGRQVRSAFSPEMLVMGGAFALMGGAVGLSLGAWQLQRQRLVVELLESQRRLVALETLKSLMVTLAHHIRNANLVIGGFSARLLKSVPQADFHDQLKRILQASWEIEAVIASLQNLTEISTIEYITQGQARMIDLKEELEARLAAVEKWNEL